MGSSTAAFLTTATQVTFTTESFWSPAIGAGTKTFPAMLASAVFEVRATTITVPSRLAL